MIFSLLFSSLLSLAACQQQSETVIYQPADSVEVEQLLSPAQPLRSTLQLARHFLGRPYVAHTLEKADPEQLVVNLRELDCTTLVETVLALTRCKAQGLTRFSDYCHALQALRYRGGQLDGYCSRLHYFAWWMADNAGRGNVRIITPPAPYAEQMPVRDFYMTAHPDAYAMLRDHPERVERIRRLEQQGNGRQFPYLPKRFTALDQQQLSFLHTGDVLAIVTSKAGLDYSHLGLAVWADDGKLHMLHASSAKGRVLLDDETLADYLARFKTSHGVSILRLTPGVAAADE